MLSPLPRAIADFQRIFPGQTVPKEPGEVIRLLNAVPRDQAVPSELGTLFAVLRAPFGADLVERIEQNLANGTLTDAPKGVGAVAAAGSFGGAALAQRLHAQVPKRVSDHTALDAAKRESAKGNTPMVQLFLKVAWEEGDVGPGAVADVVRANYKAIVDKALTLAKAEAHMPGRTEQVEEQLAFASYHASRAGVDVEPQVRAIRLTAFQAHLDTHFANAAISSASGYEADAERSIRDAVYAETFFNALLGEDRVTWPSDVPRPSV